MKQSARWGRLGAAVVVLLAALTMVALRQSATWDTMEALDRAAEELAVVEDEREEAARELAALESRRWIAEAARALGLRAPTEREVVITAGGVP